MVLQMLTVPWQRGLDLNGNGGAFGGQNMPMALSAPVNEMWQSASLSFALCHLLTQGQIYALQKSASLAQKSFLPPMVEGRWTGTMNLTEPQAGSDLAAIKTRAVKQDDHYLITGQKIYVTYGEHDMAENIVHLVLARTPDAGRGQGHICLYCAKISGQSGWHAGRAQ